MTYRSLATASGFISQQDAVKTVTTLFRRKVSRLDVDALRQIATALENPDTKAEDLARAAASVDADRPVHTLSGDGIGEILSPGEAEARLGQISADVEPEEWAQSELVGAGEMATRLGVTRTSLDNWRKAHKILALRKGVRNYVYPARQFERLAPIAGIARIRAEFDSDDTTWDWLVTVNRYTGGIEPVEWLRKGHVEEVAQAAAGALDFE